MAKLEETYGSSGLTILKVNVRETGSGRAYVDLAKGSGLTGPFVKGPFWGPEGYDQGYGPFSRHLVDRQGRRIAYWVGAKNWMDEGKRRLIEVLLAEEPAAITSDGKNK